MNECKSTLLIFKSINPHNQTKTTKLFETSFKFKFKKKKKKMRNSLQNKRNQYGIKIIYLFS